MKMNKHVELPLTEPIYSTYHYQGPCTAIAVKNPSVRNWYLNQVMNLNCSRKFLTGFTTPEITVLDSSWTENPYIDKHWISTQFTDGYINPIIRKMLDQGFYVAFVGIDDYYVKGKTWYKQRHFIHDGLICGYDQTDKTYCIYAYDSNWIYKKFWTPQKSFDAGRAAVLKKDSYCSICGLNTRDDTIEFSPKTAYDKLCEYLDSDLEKYRFDGEGLVYGMAVHEYIAEYVMRLYREDIPYERLDRRVFRLIWEHKKVMLERILQIERVLELGNDFSKKYKPIVDEADTMRMLYAAHHMKRRDSLLPIIAKKLLKLSNKERELLTALTQMMEKELKNEAVDILKK